MPAIQKKAFDAVELSRRLREQTSRQLAVLARKGRRDLLNRHLQPDAIGKIEAKGSKAA